MMRLFSRRRAEHARNEDGRFVSEHRARVKAVARSMREAMGMDIPEVLR